MTSGIKIFGREPIVWIGAIQAALAVLVNIPASPLTPAMAAWTITGLSAVLMCVEAWAVRPWSVAMLTGAIRTTVAAALLFNVAISPELSSALVAAVTLGFSLLTANSVSPRNSPDPAFAR